MCRESSAESYIAAQGFGVSNTEAEAEGAPDLFSLENRRLRNEYNFCLPPLDLGGGEKDVAKLFSCLQLPPETPRVFDPAVYLWI